MYVCVCVWGGGGGRRWRSCLEKLWWVRKLINVLIHVHQFIFHTNLPRQWMKLHSLYKNLYGTYLFAKGFRLHNYMPKGCRLRNHSNGFTWQHMIFSHTLYQIPSAVVFLHKYTTDNTITSGPPVLVLDMLEIHLMVTDVQMSDGPDLNIFRLWSEHRKCYTTQAKCCSHVNNSDIV